MVDPRARNDHEEEEVMSKFKFELGDRVKDRITSFEGIVVTQSHHINMCNRYTIEPEKVGTDGKMIDAWNIDEQNLVLVKAGVHKPIPAQEDHDEVRTSKGGPRERAIR